MAIVAKVAEKVCDCESHNKVCLMNHALVAFDRHDSFVHRFSKPVNEYPTDEYGDPKKPWIVLDSSPLKSWGSSHKIVAARVGKKWGLWKWDEDKEAYTLRVIGTPLEAADALSDLWDD